MEEEVRVGLERDIVNVIETNPTVSAFCCYMFLCVPMLKRSGGDSKPLGVDLQKEGRPWMRKHVPRDGCAPYK